MIDTSRGLWKMISVGWEDRALLRSNPSAQSDAGTWAGAPRQGQLPPPPPCSGSKCDKPRHAITLPTLTPHRCAIWQDF